MRPLTSLVRTGLFQAGKIVSFAVFGIGGLIIALVIFPLLSLLVHPAWRFRRAMRATVQHSFRFFLWGAFLLGLVRITLDKPRDFHNLRQSIVVANHPSLLDVVILLAWVPRSTVVVNGALWKNPFTAGIVRRLYISNAWDVDEMIRHCRRSFAEGDNLIIFPEGTRTPAQGENPLKRGAARLALQTGIPLQPVHIGLADPTGLRRGDGMAHVPAGYCYRYRLSLGQAIPIGRWQAMEPPLAARELTRKIAQAIRPPALVGA